MKRVIIYFIPVVISFIWLSVECHTLNPITLKGPDFLKFYLILVFGLYASVFLLKSQTEKDLKITFFFILFIMGLGVVKLIRGMILGKPIGFLTMILIAELIVTFLWMGLKSNHKNIR